MIKVGLCLQGPSGGRGGGGQSVAAAAGRGEVGAARHGGTPSTGKTNNLFILLLYFIQ